MKLVDNPSCTFQRVTALFAVLAIVSMLEMLATEGSSM